MKGALESILRRILGRLSVEVCASWPTPFTIKVMRAVNGIQLSHKELGAVIASVNAKAPCNFLVFGLGHDSLLWLRVNRGGRTVFVEDDREWFRKVLKSSRRIEAHLVDYGTERRQWKELLDSPALLNMSLPGEVETGEWDVILVDAPAGWKDTHPGRMKSIFLASRLAGNSTDVFVHDCERQVERIYCERFLHAANLQAEVELLRHYRMTNHYTQP